MSNESKKPAAKPDGNRTGAMRSWIIIATVVALFFAFYKTNPGEQAVRELTQIEFYKALDEGKLVEPVVRFIDRDEGETYLTGIGRGADEDAIDTALDGQRHVADVVVAKVALIG